MVNTVPLQLVILALALRPGSEIDDSSLGRKIKSGDHDAFRSFFDLHYDSLVRFLLSKNTPPEAAEDVIQKAFMYIWEHRQKIDPSKSLRAYIFQIAYTRMLNHHRDNKKFNDDEAIPQQADTLTPEDTSRANDLRAAINNKIQEMPEKRGTVFRLCFVEDLTYKEAAEIMNVSPKTIENHMGLAFKDMREALAYFK